MKLHLGVIEVPEPEGGTSYTVGLELEKNYALFSSFYEANEQDIANFIAEDIARATTNMMAGNPIADPFSKTNEEVTTKMHNFITSGDSEKFAKPIFPLVVPTLAAQEGLTLRTAKGKAIRRYRKGMATKEVKGTPRPSFMYSGVFEASLKGWIST
jgi:hypothetical protein